MTDAEQVKILTKQNEELRAMIAELNATIANLNETVKYLTNKIYGTKREKTPDPNQLTLDLDCFNEAEKYADPNEKEPDAEEVTVSFKTKKGNHKGRKDIFDGIPIKKIVCSLEDIFCPGCGAEMIVIGEKFDREELHIIPAKLVRIHYYKQVYKCTSCEDKQEHPVIIEAETPYPLMAHSLSAPSTVAHVMDRKYSYYETLYRLEKEYRQMGVRITRGVMSNWIIYCSLHYLKPLYERLHEELVRRDILHADETPCQVLKEDGRKAQSKSYMWTYVTGNDGLPGITLYDYKPGRSGTFPKEFLKGFEGFLHCDGYQGYNNMEDIERIGCLAHARRYFYEAIPVNPKADISGNPAVIGVNYYNSLFMTERLLKGKTPEEIKRVRNEKEAPILEEFFKWLDTLNPTGGSRLEKAVNYSIHQKQNLLGYLKDGRLEISNNSAERKCRAYALGRRNFLFHDTVDGAEASSIVYSIVETAKMNGLNTYSYLYQLLLHMPGCVYGAEDIEEMLPWSEFMQESCTKVKIEEYDAKPVGMK